MELLEILKHIEPDQLDYDDWKAVGMALKHEGLPCSVWDEWSQRDPARYHSGECETKWESFQERGMDVVTGGTLVHLAMQCGWIPPTKVEGGHALDWNDSIGAKFVPDLDQLEVEDVPHLFKRWDPVKEVTTYLKTLYKDEDIIGYVLNATFSETEERWMLEKGVATRSVGKILDDLDKYKSVSMAVGDNTPDCGAWIRVNPLDGGGISDRNVTDFRYVLVESDKLDIKTQYSLLKSLELPIATLVHSGGKSLHALVKVGASSWRQYKERVEFIYKTCQENGLEIDKADKNPSRLCRFPGFMRAGKEQYLVATNIGQPSFEAWQEYVEGLNDDLPEIESMTEIMVNGKPPLKPEFWQGVARIGSKVLVVGPSKAGKSMFLIRMAICIAEGLELFGRQFQRGPVCMINFEIEGAEYVDRVLAVYQAMGIEPTPEGWANLHIWNMRGRSDRLDKIAPVLIRRLRNKQAGYTAVVVDPIYKAITGDENNASEMALFCNYLDKICTELQTTLIYAHHFSKGAQGGKKSIDRASGSGVFGRDPDAIITLTEILLTDQDRAFHANRLASNELRKVLIKYAGWTPDDFDDDTKFDSEKLHSEAVQSDMIHPDVLMDLDEFIKTEQRKILKCNAFRLEMTLRSFAEPDPVNMFYDYPLHIADDNHVLDDACLDGVYQPQQALEVGRKKGTQANADRVSKSVVRLEQTIETQGRTKIKDLADDLGVDTRTVRRWAERSEKLVIDHGYIRGKQE